MKRALLLCWCLLACGRNRVATHVEPPPPDAGTSTPNDAAVAEPPDAGTPDAGYLIARAALHVHSANSHDGCDGVESAGPIDAPVCVAQLKAGLCAAHLDIAFMTDHPRWMDRLPFDDLLYDSGEEVLRDDTGAPVASRITCDDGRKVMLSVGYEGTHSMPLALRKHLDNGDLYAIHTDSQATLADDQALLDGVHDAGGVFFTAHSELADLPASRLQELKTDGMEWYNVHATLTQIFDGDIVGGGTSLAGISSLFSALEGLEPFLMGSNGAHPDLSYLEMLRIFPQAGLDKWHEVLGARFIAAGVGNDVHQNVKVNPLCKGAAEPVCRAAGGAVPHLVDAFVNGGPLLLSDGERIDSYPRVLRWLNNRLLVHSKTLDDLSDAVKHGRGYGIFAVFGEPGPLAFWADSPAGRAELGGTVTGQGATLRVRLPDAPAPELGATWTPAEAATAGLNAILWRTTASGRTQVAAGTAFGGTLELADPQPGIYSLEVRLTPRHLTAALGSAHSLAGHEFIWVLTNGIVVQ